ncbi:GNAT family N-acetyltransferase [Maritimibacter sp. UBA3975]|uniref:GNAT family N-acetyltransferase n=1 Tax=Maritimibacter sp. UBA3975 TaxID=1946833 RepID=UPI000C090E06|nr:GNAT family N-acetyltransferase [Maritimibacter sp. UBA3975]MAM61256.1 GNAT family N-acetyltransferase [Maritimibacter sp.]|tara:strand:- start:4171 stop:4728 length:558 start_codon:yes stop_codon:yes gene_type:complete
MKVETFMVSDQAVVETDRFVLRPPKSSDVGMLAHYSGDRRVAEETRSIPHPLPPGVTEAFVTRAMQSDRTEDVWIMDGSSVEGGDRGHEVLGVISLTRMDRNQTQLGYWVAPPFWNTGLASEAVQALVASNPLDNDTIFAEVFQDNPASARVLTNAGFAYVGDSEAFCLARNANVRTWTYCRKMR